MANFVILIGGPGLFKGCDKAHDQTWTNYIVPLQLAAQKNLYKKQSGEVFHWVLYEPPYRRRWQDDSIITKKEKKEVDGYHLHSIRKAAADKIIGKGTSSYVNRIQTIANTNGIKYKGINKPSEFWSYLRSLGDNSISRIWYSGHASGSGLMLALTHSNTCVAQASPNDMILNTDVIKNVSLKKKLNSKSIRVSKFYGCYTEGFAKEWSKTFKLGAAGAKQKIDFGVIDQPSNIVNIMERIEKTPTSVGQTGWTVHK